MRNRRGKKSKLVRNNLRKWIYHFSGRGGERWRGGEEECIVLWCHKYSGFFSDGSRSAPYRPHTPSPPSVRIYMRFLHKSPGWTRVCTTRACRGRRASERELPAGCMTASRAAAWRVRVWLRTHDASACSSAVKRMSKCVSK